MAGDDGFPVVLLDVAVVGDKPPPHLQLETMPNSHASQPDQADTALHKNASACV